LRRQENIRLPGEAGFKPTILHPSWAGFMTLATEIPAAGKRDIWIAEENRPCMTQVNKCLTEEMKTDWKFGDFQQNKWNKWSSSRITVLKKMLGVGILIETWKSSVVKLAVRLSCQGTQTAVGRCCGTLLILQY
jgi:hypothetical protein